MLQKGCQKVLVALAASFYAATAFSFSYNTEAPSAKAVMASKQAYDAQQWDRLTREAANARGDTLQIYVDYWLASREVQTARDITDVPAADLFLARYPGSYMADRLRADWVLAAAERGDYQQIVRIDEFAWLNREVRCAKMMARHAVGQPVSGQEAIDTFAAGRFCWAVLDQLAADRIVQREQLVHLMLDNLERNHTRTADRVATLIFDRANLNRYRAAVDNPASWLRQYRGQASGDDGLLVAIAIARMGRDNLTGAATELEKFAPRLSKADAGWAWSQLAFRAALNLQSRADTWYRNAGNVRLSDTGYEWRVRAALRQPIINWEWVQNAIEWMPQSLEDKIDWQYWRARALAAQGQNAQAAAIYQNISDEFHFYGQLALEELGQQIVAPPAPAPLTEAEIEQARNNPHLQQAVALFNLGLRPQAVPQWNFGLRELDDRQLLAAAEFAREQHIYDRVVSTSERTREQVDFSQRFIAPFEGRVASHARSIDVDPAWVYGLIRQESRFVMDARSVVGASGLMQLMPATAKYVANRIGMRDFQPSRVNEFEINTILGTHYLRMVLQDLGGSLVLASAAYNAGPGRPAQWRRSLSRPVEGAIFAETIPFSETRDYVKHVLSNATYYSAMFTGEPQSLKARLGVITPAN